MDFSINKLAIIAHIIPIINPFKAKDRVGINGRSKGIKIHPVNMAPINNIESKTKFIFIP